VVEQDSSVFVVMELVDGAPLRKSIGDEAVTLAKRVEWLCDVARALAAAHRAGFVHRDVKPENVLVTKDGAVKVLDFWAARPPAGGDEATTSSVPGEGVLLGTPLYMAPEQLDGAPIDGRTDQFAWGVLAYELLVGRVPWGRAGEPASAIFRRILTEEPVA